MADMTKQPNRRYTCCASAVAPDAELLSISAFPSAVRLPMTRMYTVQKHRYVASPGGKVKG